MITVRSSNALIKIEVQDPSCPQLPHSIFAPIREQLENCPDNVSKSSESLYPRSVADRQARLPDSALPWSAFMRNLSVASRMRQQFGVEVDIAISHLIGRKVCLVSMVGPAAHFMGSLGIFV
jgi:hypothetical protein